MQTQYLDFFWRECAERAQGKDEVEALAKGHDLWKDAFLQIEVGAQLHVAIHIPIHNVQLSSVRHQLVCIVPICLKPSNSSSTRQTQNKPPSFADLRTTLRETKKNQNRLNANPFYRI